MKKYLLLLAVIALFTSCKEEEPEVELRTYASCIIESTITNKEEVLEGHVLPGDTINMSLKIDATSNGKARLDTLVIDTDFLRLSEFEQDTTDIENVLPIFQKVIPINKSFEFEIDTTITVQFILPIYKVKYSVEGLLPRVYIISNLLFSDADGRYQEDGNKGVDLKFMNTENIEYTFKLYNNYVGKPFDDPTGLGYNLYTQEYMNNPCILDNSCFSPRDFEDSRFLELPTIYNMSYLPEANPDEKFFVPAFGNLDGFAGTGGLLKSNSYNVKRRYFNHGGNSEYYSKIIPEVEIGDVIIIIHEKITIKINDSFRYPRVYLEVLDIVEANEDSYIEFAVTISYHSMNVFNEYHGL